MGRMDAVELGRRVRAARAYAGLNRAEMAEQLGISPNTLWKIETGRRELRPGEVHVVAEVCRVPRWLLIEDWPPNND